MEKPSLGSSPRGRGKPAIALSVVRDAGLIPARAGKTAPRTILLISEEAHPRAGGENIHSTKRADSWGGSSPRGRGKQPASVYLVFIVGLIPARAGKTASRRSSRTPPWAHPRSGGENVFGDKAVTGANGLIPARAGKTEMSSGDTGTLWAHPRAGGENTAYMRDGHPEMGSSPRGRGKPADRAGGLAVGGLIPARAGKTVPDWEHKALPGAHPRASGENPPTVRDDSR